MLVLVIVACMVSAPSNCQSFVVSDPPASAMVGCTMVKDALVAEWQYQNQGTWTVQSSSCVPKT